MLFIEHLNIVSALASLLLSSLAYSTQLMALLLVQQHHWFNYHHICELQWISS